ncbi:MAG: hypothetical protein AB1649_00930 [Chloroflexota bacterium]
MEKLIIDIIGWIGAVAYLLAFGLVSARKVEPDSWIYQGMNVFAGLLLITNNFYLRAYPSTALNVAWVGLAALTLSRKYRGK